MTARRLVCVAANPSIDKTADAAGLSAERPNRLEDMRAVAGGKGLNVARAARTLGARPVAVGILAGHAGRWIAEQMSALGIDAHWVWTPGETRTCLSIVEGEGGDLLQLNEPGPEIAAEAWLGMCQAVEDLISGGPTVMTISGSLPPGADPDGYARLCDSARQQGALALLDAHGRAGAVALGARPWLVKVNAEEAAELTGISCGTTSEAVAAARDLVRRGARSSLVTIGPRGAVLVDEDRAFRVRAPASVGSYPVGSGDALLGGLAAGLAAGSALLEAVPRAAAAAAANASARGAGEFAAGEVRLLTDTAAVEPLDDC